MLDFLRNLFDTAGFPPRWNCGDWTAGHGWLHILSDLGIWSAYFAIPSILVYFVLRRRDAPFPKIFWLFGAFILACGTTHLIEAIIFWHPVYRLAGVIKLLTAVVSWGTVAALIPTVPKALSMRTPDELEREIAARKQAEAALQRANAELEERVQVRTADLAKTNATLQFEREMLRITLASIGDAVITTDVTGCIAYMNGVAASLTGWIQEEAVGKPLDAVFNIVNEETREVAENPAKRALEEGVIVRLVNHTVLIRKDGTERPIDDSAAPIRDGKGDVLGCVLVFRDITERRRAVQELADEKGRIESIVNHVIDGIIAIDEDGTVEAFNPAAERLFGYKAKEVIGQNVKLLMPQPFHTEHDGYLADYRRTGQAKIIGIGREVEGRCKDGSTFPMGLAVSEFWLGKRRYFTGLVRDITKQRRAEESLRESAERAAADLQDMSRLHAIGNLCVRSENDLNKCLEGILDTAIAITRADKGKIQLLDAESSTLKIAAQRGFDEPFLAFFASVGLNQASACGVALKSAERIVVEDVTQSKVFAGQSSLDFLLEAGVHAVQSTPLMSSGGKVLGVISTHFGQPHRPAERELRLVDLLARQGADYLERKRAEEVLHENERALRASQNTFHELVERSPFGIYIVDSQFRIALMNASSQTGAFRNVQPVIGRDFAEATRILWPEPVAADIIAHFRNTLDTGEPYYSPEFINPRGDIEAVESYEWELHRIALPDGEHGVVCYYFDSSKLRQTQKALQAKEAELQLVISRTPLLLSRCSRDLRYVFVNRACAEFLGRTPGVIVGRPISEIMGEAALATIMPHVERVLRGETVEFETEIRYARVGRRVMRALYTPDRDEGGQVIGWVATVSDITDHKQLEREREERAAELAVALGKRTDEARRAEKAEQLLREADRRKDEFLATLAHELRNPLAPLLIALELVRCADDNKPLMEQARSMMERQVSQLVRLVDDLLDISRITQGKLQLRKERVELAGVLNAAIETARPLIESSDHELTVTVSTRAIHVQADPIRLAQVFSNLLNNAAKYTDKGGHIWLTAKRSGALAVVSVRDTGIGIATEQCEQIFNMFSQMAPALERSQGGLGIGLSLVKGLVELHGGTIDARSGGPGKGSEFTVHLPIGDVPVEAPPLPSRGDTMGHVHKCRILVVDDLRDAADGTAILFQTMGHETRTAYDGLEAVQTAAELRPNIVLLDIGLPKMNGYDVARHIRSEPWGAKVVLVALTGWGQEADKRRALEAGFDHHLTKPVEAADLEKLLAGLAPVGQE
jgi:PAS domain S-box-containing protein